MVRESTAIFDLLPRLQLSIQRRLVSRQSSTQRRCCEYRIDIRRQQCQVARIQAYVLLKTSILVMEMICWLHIANALAILFRASLCQDVLISLRLLDRRWPWWSFLTKQYEHRLQILLENRIPTSPPSLMEGSLWGRPGPRATILPTPSWPPMCCQSMISTNSSARVSSCAHTGSLIAVMGFPSAPAAVPALVCRSLWHTPV